MVGGDPTNQAPATAWNLRTNVRINGAKLYVANMAEIKLRRQAKAFVQLQPFGYGALAAYLAGDDAAAAGARERYGQRWAVPRDAVKAEENLLILIGSELRGSDLKRLIEFGLTLPGAKFALLSDYVNSRGAADMGLLPDMLPGYTPVGSEALCGVCGACDAGHGHAGDVRRGGGGRACARCMSWGRTRCCATAIDAAALKNTFVVVQEMFLTETAVLADVVLPAANLYEKSGSVTNQLWRSAAGEEGGRSSRACGRTSR